MRDTALGSDGVFGIARCARCGLVFLDPQPPPENLARHYGSGYVPYQKSNPAVAFLKRRQWGSTERRMRRALGGKAGSVLEIGCARGEFVEFLVSRGWRAAGLEMDTDSARAARMRGIAVREGAFEDASFGPGERYDCIVLSYVLEHLPSPRAALVKIRGLLSDSGIAVISIPNYESWDRKIFGRYWHGFDVPRHFYFFTRDIVRRYARETGFVLESVRYSAVPNDWIGGIARALRARDMNRAAAWMTYKNPVLAALLFPLSMCAALMKKSSRFMFFMRASNGDSVI
jgi:SAM-dependent methyltransferase